MQGQSHVAQRQPSVTPSALTQPHHQASAVLSATTVSFTTRCTEMASPSSRTLILAIPAAVTMDMCSAMSQCVRQCYVKTQWYYRGRAAPFVPTLVLLLQPTALPTP